MHKSFIKQPIYWVIFSISVLCLVTYNHLEPGLLQSFLKDLGIAGIIALILTFTIEKFNRESHANAADALVDKINRNLFEAIYKRNIPNEIFSEVEKCLLHSDVHRTSHEVSYALEPVPSDLDDKIDCQRHLRCKATSSYVIHNSTDSTISHNVKLSLEKPLNPDWNDYCRVTEVKIDSVKLSEEQLEQAMHIDDLHITFSKLVSIPPRGSIRVYTAFELIKQRTDIELYSSRIPSTGIGLTVTTSDPNIEVNAYAKHHEKLVKTMSTDYSSRWQLDYGIFPHQSISLWWQDKKATQCEEINVL